MIRTNNLYRAMLHLFTVSGYWVGIRCVPTVYAVGAGAVWWKLQW